MTCIGIRRLIRPRLCTARSEEVASPEPVHQCLPVSALRSLIPFVDFIVGRVEWSKGQGGWYSTVYDKLQAEYFG